MRLQWFYYITYFHVDVVLVRHKQDISLLDLPSHVLNSQGFSGAEIEYAVKEALFEAFAEGADKGVRDCHLAHAIRSTVPISTRIDKLAEWRESVQNGLMRSANDDGSNDRDPIRQQLGV